MTQNKDRIWVGFDLDGTLANTITPTGNLASVGEPVPEMVERLRGYLEKGARVKIFTARAGYPGQKKIIEHWLRENGLPDLEITATKDYDMSHFYDDRAFRVLKNTGQII